jgi:hypothetical protein
MTTSNWLSPSATRAWCAEDPILDWLDLYGEAKGFIRDDRREGYDRDTDMRPFITEKGRQFEAAVMRCVED